MTHAINAGVSIYRGDIHVVTGTVRECANSLGVNEATIWFYLSPTHKRRVFKQVDSGNGTVAIRTDTPDSDDARLCVVCDRVMASGYVCCDDYYCSEPCRDAAMNKAGTTWEEHYIKDGDCYWTEWEDEAA